MKEIGRVSQWVNAHIKPVSDMEHWGVIDRWDYPSDGKGDCEDYALFKRKILIEEGFPRQALLMTVVKDEHNEGHSVLTVKTSAGEFVLDNMNDEVKPWDRTGYRFVKRQSQPTRTYGCKSAIRRRHQIMFHDRNFVRAISWISPQVYGPRRQDA